MTYIINAQLQPGIAGVDDTLRMMGTMARQAAGTAPWGHGLFRDLEPFARAWYLRNWLDHHFAFEPDPPGVERVRDPREMIDAMARGEIPVRGDCDDAATFGATLAIAAGLPVRWKILRFGGREDFEHVYAEVTPDRGRTWIDLDVTRPDALPGLLEGMRIDSRTVEL